MCIRKVFAYNLLMAKFPIFHKRSPSYLLLFSLVMMDAQWKVHISHIIKICIHLSLVLLHIVTTQWDIFYALIFPGGVHKKIFFSLSHINIHSPMWLSSCGSFADHSPKKTLPAFFSWSSPTAWRCVKWARRGWKVDGNWVTRFHIRISDTLQSIANVIYTF